MILCKFASQNVHLTYSVIKFLRFEGLVWQGDSLPFVSRSLGELMHAQISMTNQKGERQTGLGWENGQLFGTFNNEDLYDLTLRLEYRAPFFLEEIGHDFANIHPYKYEISVDFLDDFLAGVRPEVGVRLGQNFKAYSLQSQEDTLHEGHRVEISRELDHVGITVRHQSNIPYGHTFFPAIKLGG